MPTGTRLKGATLKLETYLLYKGIVLFPYQNYLLPITRNSVLINEHEPEGCHNIIYWKQQLWSIEIHIKLSEIMYEFRTKSVKELVLSEKSINFGQKLDSMVLSKVYNSVP